MDTPAPPPPDLVRQLAADAYRHLIRSVCLALPPPPGGTPDDFACRDRAAVARIGSLAPASAAEANLAAEFFVASEQGVYCVRLAQLPETAPDMAQKYRAEARSMMREA